MEIRRATREDSDNLIDLSRRTPMVGSISAYTDRSPDFFMFSKSQGDDHLTFIAEQDDVIVGCMSCITSTVRVGGQITKRLYLCDLKVAPEAGRMNLGKRLSALPIEMALKDESYSIADFDIIENNQRILKVISWVDKELCPAQAVGVLRTYQLMPYIKYPPIKGYTIRHANIEDIPEMSSILHETYKEHDCSPVFDHGALEQALGKDPCFNIDCFRVAEKDGRVVACGAFWDQSPIRKTIVTAYSAKVKISLAVLSCLKPFLPIPALPKPGQPLRYLYFRFPGCLPGHQEALRAILHHECNHLRKSSNFHFVWAGFHERDPLLNILSKIWKTKFNINIYRFDTRRSSERKKNKPNETRPIYVDLALI